MNKYFLLFFGLFSSLIFSQIRVDYNHDLNGNPIEGEFHTFLKNESPGVQIKIEGELTNYEKGLYVDDNKQKHEGYILFNAKKISFRKRLDDFELTKSVLASEIEYLKLGIDSFFIAKKVNYKGKILKKPILIKYISTIGENEIGKVYQFNGINHYLKRSYFVIKTPESDIWENFNITTKEDFKTLVFKYFSKAPYVNYKTKEDQFSKDDLLTIIKTNEFYQNYIKGDSVYYNENWQQLLSSKGKKYSAKIVGLKDSIWTIDYFNGKDKIYEANYSSINPNKKHGLFKFFDDNNIIEERKYSNDSLIEFKSFYKNKVLKKHILYTLDVLENNVQNRYVALNDSLGVSLLESNGNAILIDNKEGYKHHYVNNKYSYSQKGNEKSIFYLGEYDIETNKFKKELSYFFQNHPLRNELMSKKGNAGGVILISMVLDYQGKVISYEIMNSLGSDFDKIVSDFYKEEIILEGGKGFKFKGLKLKEDRGNIQFLLPITFLNKRFEPIYNGTNNYWFYQHMFHQQMMMHNQMSAPAMRF